MKKKRRENPLETGIKAFKEGQLGNPYDEDKNFWESREWQRGFDIAYSQNLTRILTEGG